IIAVVAMIAAFVLSPLLFPKSARRTDAIQSSREPHGLSTGQTELPVVYWRPGCIYYIRLRIELGVAGNRATWVDISRDSAAAQRVREINDGNATVPTVLFGDASRTNPEPRWVKEQLTAGQ